ncbi:hypothetical protein DIURU_000757 [Diutina rugosa]|uniref:Uncharacterized protein n=1 Tax=Diutina rugosa TaxID=5481 RepID=A0A642V1Q2_DIURU|nr:uncharacterized protein DIURU_000757 [Diutina rugosa]KAA8907073.1 hypothetical protein DIURU_000757 [Diutina rugosa]
MPGASRSELLRWLTELLDMKVDSVESCGTGAVFCQLLDYIYRDIPMHRVKFDTTNDFDYRTNWKILQMSFNKHNITKVIDVERLLKCRLQDNLELLQWFKKTVDERGPFEPYDAAARRAMAPPAPGAGSGRSSVAASATGRRVSSGTTPQRRPPSQSSVGPHPTPVRHPTPPSGANGAATGAGTGASAREVADLREQLESATKESAELRKSCDSLETERNFYFNKLRNIEILTQNILETPADVDTSSVASLTVAEVMKQVQSILYRVDDGFQLNEVDDESF